VLSEESDVSQVLKSQQRLKSIALHSIQLYSTGKVKVKVDADL